jgi:hypothetical protein
VLRIHRKSSIALGFIRRSIVGLTSPLHAYEDDEESMGSFPIRFPIAMKAHSFVYCLNPKWIVA